MISQIKIQTLAVELAVDVPVPVTTQHSAFRTEGEGAMEKKLGPRSAKQPTGIQGKSDGPAGLILVLSLNA